MRSTILLLSLLLLVTAAGAQVGVKQVASGAGDVRLGVTALPSDGVGWKATQGNWIPVVWERSGTDRWAFSAEVRVGVPGPVSLFALGPNVAAFELTCGVPGESWCPAEELVRGGRARGHRVEMGDLLPGFGAHGLVTEPMPAGTWRLALRVEGTIHPGPGYLYVQGGGSAALQTSLSGPRLTSDRSVGLRARLRDDHDGARSSARLLRARVEVRSGAGTTRLALHDDGRHDDLLAGDGVFGALLPRGLSGKVRARIVAEGVTAGGERFTRSDLHAFPVLEPVAGFTGRAAGTVVDGDLLALELGAWSVRPGEPLQVAAEVWGLGAGGASVPVTWLARRVVPAEEEPGVVRLFLDGRWLNEARAAGPLELRAVRLMDPDTHVVLDELPRVEVRAPRLPAVVGQPARGVTSDLHSLAIRAGRPALPTGTAATARVGGQGVFRDRALLLVHGWCSDGDPWPSADFSDPKRFFRDPDANRSHDEFARLLLAFGSDLDTFGVVAHSQGGQAALQLLTYYESGLDRAQGPRVIQSVGTPYQGTPLADLGFFSCGNNFDLTVSGSAMWLSTIPTWARKRVSYWTTSNDGGACNFFTNLLLGSPNDGVIEQARGQLPGASSMGHVTGWCHTTGMSNPAQYQDLLRNLEMDLTAAR